MVDLPMHNAQVDLMRRMAHDPMVQEQFAFHWGTPYWVGYGLQLLASAVLPVATAGKVVVALAIVGLPLSMRLLLSRTPHWTPLALLGFPLSFGFSFTWGFTAWFVAVPLVVTFFALFTRWLERPRAALGVGVWALGMVVFATHGLAFGLAGLVAGLACLAWVRRPRELLLRLIPLLGLVPPLLLWVGSVLLHESDATRPMEWALGVFRLLQVPVFLLGLLGPEDYYPPVIALSWATLLGWALLAMPFLLGARLDLRSRALAPLAAVSLLHLLAPYGMWSVAILYQRFTIFIPVFLFASLRGTPPKRILLGTTLLLTLGLLVANHTRCAAFDLESRALDPIIDAMEPGALVLPIGDDYHSEAVPIPARLPWHLAYNYQLAKGGVVESDLAKAFEEPIRYADIPAARERIELRRHPEDPTYYDYYVARTRGDALALLPEEVRPYYAEEARSGPWALLTRVATSTDHE